MSLFSKKGLVTNNLSKEITIIKIISQVSKDAKSLIFSRLRREPSARRSQIFQI